MKKQGHTPLPWAMVYGDDGHHHIVADDGPIAMVSVQADADRQDANANVLLAAPGMLDLLKAQRERLGDGRNVEGWVAEWLEEIDAAIAKAEGRE